MASLQVLLRDKLSQLVFKELVVEDVRELGPQFRRLRVSAPWLRAAACAPGDKLQIMIMQSGPRTYSPFAHDPSAGSFELLAFVHADTPAGAFIRSAQPGTRFRAFGPRSSLPLASMQGPIVLFGDETSFGVAAALRHARGDADGLSCVFECSQPSEAGPVLSDLALTRCSLVQRQAAQAHLVALDSQLRVALSERPGAALVLTGHAQTIQALRARFKAQPAPYAAQKVKAYWADGKRGLD
jgi:NADPH-dependent ferric siderophore reductase